MSPAGSPMPRPAVIALILLALAVPALGQRPLVAEQVERSERLCLYGGLVSDRFNDSTNRVVRVRSTQTCPLREPVTVSDRPPPPTAMFSEQTIDRGLRICIYKQGDQQWRRALPLQALCPIAAGMLPPERRERDYERDDDRD